MLVFRVWVGVDFSLSRSVIMRAPGNSGMSSHLFILGSG